MRVPNYKKEISEFINELNKIGLTKDRRQMILLLGIYSEYLVNELLRTRLPRFGFPKRMPQSLKLKILFSHSTLKKGGYEVFDKLNQIRNEYAHNLNFDSRKIKRYTSATPLNLKMNKQEWKNLDDALRKNIYDRFEKICAINIIWLFQKLGGFEQ